MPVRLRGQGRRRAPTLCVVLALGLGAATCGGRSELEIPPPLPPQPECDVDEDCPGYNDLCAPVRCVDTERYKEQLPDLPIGVPLPPRVCFVLPELTCDDNDPCTADSCDPLTGLCTYGPSTFDKDGDQHYSPLPGTVAGAPGSCGDDCDDTSAAAYPGNIEICDGVDNDCNGVVDDGANFIPLQESPIRISGDIAPAGPGGLAFNGETYLAVYWGTSQGFDMYETRLDPLGNKLAPVEEPIAIQNADSTGGPIEWIGDRYGLAWQDRRDSDYEVYFTLLDGEGAKVIPDTRLSFATGFSVNVNMTWTGNEFFVVWQDERSGLFEIYGQRVSVDGEPLGANLRLSPEGGAEDEWPIVAAGTSTVGLVYTNGLPSQQVVRFQSFNRMTLDQHSVLQDVSDGSTQAVYPTITWNQDHYLVAWYDKSASPKAIYATSLSEDGEVLRPPTPVSSPGQYRSRYPQLLPLGDRTLVIYSDDRDQNTGYELYSVMIDKDLMPLFPEQRLTFALYDSIYPVATFGPEGDVGILFRDDRNGEQHVWFTRLGCVTGG